jgi:nicotinamidase/pyrazinamidase
MQYDFILGSLAVPGAEKIIGPIEDLMPHFPTVVMTQDWHPLLHKSFAANHKDRKPFETIAMAYGEQTLWPVHCTAGSRGARLEVHDTEAALIIRKGMNPDVDSYSAFRESDRTTFTGLTGFLDDRQVSRVFLVGLAFDYCVGYSALDAVDSGFRVVVIENLCRGIDLNGSYAGMQEQLLKAGVELRDV